MDCQYHENTADIEDNQILAWTLYCMARSGFCREKVAELVRRAFGLHKDCPTEGLPG